VILVVTNKSDAHADAVIRVFNKLERPIFRLNTEDILSRYRFRLEFNGEGWGGRLEDAHGRTLFLEAVRTAWFRRPSTAFTGPIAELDVENGLFAHNETEAFLEVLYSLPHLRWVNDPFAAERAKVKAQQLVLANKLKMRVPRTIITADPECAREFVADLPGDVLVKSVYTADVTLGGINQGILSSRISKEIFAESSDSIRFCPTLLQEYCDKRFELRITVVGDRVTAVKIDSQSDHRTATDWRASPKVPQCRFDLPDNVQGFCKDFLSQQGLLYGAMDFIVTPDDEYIFLENNPWGNYLWQDAIDSVDITGDMVALLTNLDEQIAR
jgi:glutathione synthase/RimK-type ligase-like ATP-grasp enzyme